MLTIGIDPGLSGAIAILGLKTAIVLDMPVMRHYETGFVKNAIDTTRLAELLDPYAIDEVWIEKEHAFGGQGASSGFSLGMSYWGAVGVASALTGATPFFVEPRMWKAHYQLGRDKTDSLDVARILFPDVDLHLAKHHNRAEALLIAKFGRDLAQRK